MLQISYLTRPILLFLCVFLSAYKLPAEFIIKKMAQARIDAAQQHTKALFDLQIKEHTESETLEMTGELNFVDKTTTRILLRTQTGEELYQWKNLKRIKSIHGSHVALMPEIDIWQMLFLPQEKDESALIQNQIQFLKNLRISLDGSRVRPFFGHHFAYLLEEPKSLANQPIASFFIDKDTYLPLQINEPVKDVAPVHLHQWIIREYNQEDKQQALPLVIEHLVDDRVYQTILVRTRHL